MSQENVNLAMAGVAAINETYRIGDMGPWTRHVEAAFEAEVVLEARGGAFTEGDWRGRAGAVQFVANAMEVLESMWLRADEVIDLGDELLVVLTTFGGHARHTGIDVENSIASVFGMRAGKVESWRVYQSKEEALESIGQQS